jgi:hypothetical protein
MSDCKILLANRGNGEVAGIQKINMSGIKGLKRWISVHKKFEDTDIVVFDSSTVEVAEYFERYIKKISRFKKFVGIFSPRLRELCYEENDVRPLHIAQALSCNFTNYKTALRRNEKGWAKQLIAERLELYKEADQDFGLSMSVMNQYLWEEYKHDLTGFKFLKLQPQTEEMLKQVSEKDSYEDDDEEFGELDIEFPDYDNLLKMLGAQLILEDEDQRLYGLELKDNQYVHISSDILCAELFADGQLVRSIYSFEQILKLINEEKEMN